MAAAERPLLEIEDLAVSFEGAGGAVPAVDGLSLAVHPRQTLAVVGESGCGKSVTAMTVLRLIPSARVDRGSIRFQGRDLLGLSRAQMLAVRGGEIAMIFQEPMTSLNPVQTIGEQVMEAILLHRDVARPLARRIAERAIAEVGIPDARRRLRAYPHQLSGGMRQRVMIAMALACRPRLLLADEPTTALDVTTQAQVLDLLARLQRRRGMAVMLITHDLGVVARRADVVCVMYAGRAVEYAPVDVLFKRPAHPYTRGLLAAIPRLGGPRGRLATIEAVVGDPAQFTRLPGFERGVVPWWPAGPPPPDLAPPPASPTVLHRIGPGHWVGCWRTRYLEENPSPGSDLSFRESAPSRPPAASRRTP